MPTTKAPMPTVYARAWTIARASRQLNLPSNGLRFFVAAVREAFEECGLLLAYDARGEVVDLSAWDESQLRDIRLQLSAGQLSHRRTLPRARLAPGGR